MYLAIPTQSSCAPAWVAAASGLIDHADEGYNVVIDVENPWAHSDNDNAVITLVDKFLREHEANPIITVANTIFPQALYDAHGSPGFYDVYHREFDKLPKTRGWGRYFERMTRHRMADGGTYNPLQRLIDKIQRQAHVGKKFSSAYELAVYDPLLDGRSLRGGQCLSFLSFKLHTERGLLLTAMYRNHTYITRCLGNLIGLGRLLAFVAKEADIKLGSLTVISTHAELDTGKGWGIKDARDLVMRAAGLLRVPARSAADFGAKPLRLAIRRVPGGRRGEARNGNH